VTRDSLAGSTETHRPNPLRGGNIALRRHEAEYCTYRHRAIVGPDQAVPHTFFFFSFNAQLPGQWARRA
jgi:hypothetical protein